MKWLIPLAITICSLGFVSCNKGDDPVPARTSTPTSQEQEKWEIQCPEMDSKKPNTKPKPEGTDTGNGGQ